MSKSSERFSYEWNLYKKQHNNITIPKVIDLLKKQGHSGYYPEKISKLKNGKKLLDNYDLSVFSELFGVREKYLSGEDDYRTEKERFIAQQNEAGLFSAFHKILVALGYADTDIRENDFNDTFPPNTKIFLESLKEKLEENNISLICDVNADTYITIPTQYYKQFLSDVLDYMVFKLNKLFSNADMIPPVILEDGSTLSHPSTTIELKDGSSIKCNIKYIPNAEYDNNSLQDAISISITEPTTQEN